MPIYEYRCAACGHEQEVLQKMSDAPLSDCPACGKPAMSKLISAAGFQLKGTGWYATDFKAGTRPGPKDKDANPKEETKKEEPKKAADASAGATTTAADQ
ncbi:MAG TPA: zinc ribbon domain-containing protein [Burkholderiales bacterium]|nr:zinc ribbon domain-containing protein [Burkholderiales bacterium]